MTQFHPSGAPAIGGVTSIALDMFVDTHLHWRGDAGDDYVFETTAPSSAVYCEAGVLMPNTKPPLTTGERSVAYGQRVQAALEKTRCAHFTPILTMQITPDTTPEMVDDAVRLGVTTFKVYPRGMAHNSEHGVLRYRKLAPVYETLQSWARKGVRVVLCLHPAHPGADIMDAETLFLRTARWLASMFPDLPIVLEHLSTKRMGEAVPHLGKNVRGGITAVHMTLITNDILVGGIDTYAYCMPPVQRRRDRAALIRMATSGNPCYILGSDSAPHKRELKESRHDQRGCAGLFSAPVLPEVLAGIFESAGRLDRLKDFASTFPREVYGLPPAKRQFELVREPRRVPPLIGGFQPFRAEYTLPFSIRTPIETPYPLGLG